MTLVAFERKREADDLPTVETVRRHGSIAGIGAVTVACAAIQRALETEKPVLVLGEPGVGKTTAFQAICDHWGFPYLVASQASNSAVGLLRALNEAYGYGTVHGYAFDLQRIFLDRVSDCRNWITPRQPPLLVVDEFQTLSLTLLRELLLMQEVARFPLVLSGNDRRLAKASKKDESALLQIQDRIGFGGMEMRIGKPDAKDCAQICNLHRIEGMDAHRALQRFGAATSLRSLLRLIEKAEELAGPGRCAGIGEIYEALGFLFQFNKRALADIYSTIEGTEKEISK